MIEEQSHFVFTVVKDNLLKKIKITLAYREYDVQHMKYLRCLEIWLKMEIEIKIKNDISFLSGCAIAHEMAQKCEKQDQNSDQKK